MGAQRKTRTPTDVLVAFSVGVGRAVKGIDLQSIGAFFEHTGNVETAAGAERGAAVDAVKDQFRCIASLRDRQSRQIRIGAFKSAFVAELAAETVRIDTLAESGDASARELIRKSAWEIAELACNVTPEMPEDGFDGILALGGFFRCGTFFRTECENALARIRKEYHFVYEPFKMIDAARDYALHLYRKETR